MKIRVPKTNVDKKKAGQAILYICNRMSNCAGFGSTVLNKVLFYADQIHYLKHKKTITGFGYIKQKFGPTPKPNEFLEIRSELIEAGKLEEREVNFFGRVQKRPCAIQPDTDISCFDNEEIKNLEEVISAFGDSTGKMVSDLSHSEMSWELADLMEELPHFTSLLTEAVLEEKDLQWGRSQIEKHGLANVC